MIHLYPRSPSSRRYHQHPQFLFLNVLPPLTTLSTTSILTSFAGAFFLPAAFPAALTFFAVALDTLAVVACNPRGFAVTIVVPALELADESILNLPTTISTSSDGSAAVAFFVLAGAALLPGLETGADFCFEATRSAVLARDAAVVVVSVAEGFVGDIGRAPCGFIGDTYDSLVGDGGCGSVRVLFDLGDRTLEIAGAAG